MGEVAPTTTAADDEKTKKKTKEEEERSDDDDDDDSDSEEEEEHRAPIKISNLDDLNAIKRAYEEMFCDGLLHTEKIKENALGFKHENLHRERGVRIRVCRAVIPGIFEEERWIRREVSRGSFFATVDVSVRVWVRDYERDFDRVHSVLRTRGFALGGVLRRRRRGRRRGRQTRRG